MFVFRLLLYAPWVAIFLSGWGALEILIIIIIIIIIIGEGWGGGVICDVISSSTKGKSA